MRTDIVKPMISYICSLRTDAVKPLLLQCLKVLFYPNDALQESKGPGVGGLETSVRYVRTENLHLF